MSDFPYVREQFGIECVYCVSEYLCVRLCVCTGLDGLLTFNPLTTTRVASGEDMAYEHVHHHPVGVHRGSVGSEVYQRLAGVPLRPHHDGAAAPPHPVQDFRGT